MSIFFQFLMIFPNSYNYIEISNKMAEQKIAWENHQTDPGSSSHLTDTTSRGDRALEMLVNAREVIPFYGLNSGE